MKFEKAFYITHTQCCTLAPYLSMNVNVKAKENEKWKSDTAHALDSEMKNKSTSLHRERTEHENFIGVGSVCSDSFSVC